MRQINRSSVTKLHQERSCGLASDAMTGCGAPPSSDNGDQEESRAGEITSITKDQMTITYNNEPEVWLRCD